MTRAFTGRPARAIRNRFVAEMADTEALNFPLQVSLADPLWRVPAEAVCAQLVPVWAGQAVALLRELPAGQLVERLAAESTVRVAAIDVVASLSGRDALLWLRRDNQKMEGSHGALHSRHR
jgi:NAD(P)H-dependent flavin oxidoreductase YrpB (nitropropane dioxygenase family)